MVIEAKSNIWGLLGVQLDLFVRMGQRQRLHAGMQSNGMLHSSSSSPQAGLQGDQARVARLPEMAAALQEEADAAATAAGGSMGCTSHGNASNVTLAVNGIIHTLPSVPDIPTGDARLCSGGVAADSDCDRASWLGWMGLSGG